MLFLVFYFILFCVLIFQGTHVAGEVKNPLGTVPEEVGQASLASARWGLLLIGIGFLGLIIGLLGFHWTGLVALLLDLFGRFDPKTVLETERGKGIRRLFREQVGGEQTGK